MWDPASSSPAPRSPERHTLSGRQPRGQSSPHIISASTTVPSIRPVWWILFSALLSWVIWGIIPKVSKQNCSVRLPDSFRLCRTAWITRQCTSCWTYFLYYTYLPALFFGRRFCRYWDISVFFFTPAKVCYITSKLARSAGKKKRSSLWNWKIQAWLENSIKKKEAYVLQSKMLCDLCREARIRHVCRMWKSDPWPVHTKSLPRPGVACSLPEVCRVQPVPGWDLHLFCPGRQNLLQKRLCKVGIWKYSQYEHLNIACLINLL